jgi:hypothetical protein
MVLLFLSDICKRFIFKNLINTVSLPIVLYTGILSAHILKWNGKFTDIYLISGILFEISVDF